MQDKLFAKVEAGKIETVWHHRGGSVGNEAGVTGVRVKSTTDGSTRDIDAHGFFVAIGHHPNTQLFDGQLTMNNGYTEIRSGTGGNAADLGGRRVRRRRRGRPALSPRSPRPASAAWPHWTQSVTDAQGKAS